MNQINNAQRISIILTDDHALVRGGIKSLLEDEVNLVVIDEASNGQEALTKIDKLKPDIVIIDIRMPVMNGLDAVKALNETQNNTTKAIVLSMHHSEEYILQAVEAGAYGYILKDAPKEELLKAIYKVHGGEKYFSGDTSNIIVNKYLEKMPQSSKVLPVQEVESAIVLTKREQQILNLILSGLSNKEIAEQLAKSIRTIETHRFNLMKKMNAKNVTELAIKAKNHHLI